MHYRIPAKCLLYGVLLTFPFSVFAEVLTGRVIRVADGDTVTVLDHWKTQHKVRLQGIDAPERGQPYGKASGKHLSGLVAGRFVVVEYEKRDRYKRIVGKVLLSGEDVNLRQIEAGLAWHYKKYEMEQSAEDRALYAAAEVEAREAKRGLWVEPEPEPVAPWEWRKLRRKK